MSEIPAHLVETGETPDRSWGVFMELQTVWLERL